MSNETFPVTERFQHQLSYSNHREFLLQTPILRVNASTFIQIIPNLTGDKTSNANPFYGFSLVFFQQ